MTRTDADLLAAARTGSARFPGVLRPLRRVGALLVLAPDRVGHRRAGSDGGDVRAGVAFVAALSRHGRRLGGAVAVRDRAQPAAPVPQAQPHRERGSRAVGHADGMGRVRGLRGRRRAHGAPRRWRPLLRVAVRALPAEQQRALELRVVQQLDYEEVAGALGCTQNAARLRVSRALRALGLKLRGAQA